MDNLCTGAGLPPTNRLSEADTPLHRVMVGSYGICSVCGGTFYIASRNKVRQHRARPDGGPLIKSPRGQLVHDGRVTG